MICLLMLNEAFSASVVLDFIPSTSFNDSTKLNCRSISACEGVPGLVGVAIFYKYLLR